MPAAIILAVALCLPSIDNGLVMDDHIQKLMLRGGHDLPWPETAPWNLYALIPGDAEFMERSEELGTGPWWGSTSFQAIFFRPISSLSIYLDYLLWPDNPALMHLHSLFWLAALLVLAVFVYRRFLGPGPLFGLAALLFVLDDAHVHPATWVANRNSLIAAALALAVLLAHDRWRRDGQRAGAVLGPVILGVSLLAGEFALGIFAYLLSYAVFMEKSRIGARIASMAPYLAVIVAWRISYNLMGYGAHGSDLYIDPMSDPAGFLAAAAGRLPLLLSAQYGAPGSELHMMLHPDHQLTHIAIAATWVALLLVVIWPLLKSSSQARFFFLGSVLALVPACATFPHDRLLLLSGVGAMVVVAMFLEPYLDPVGERKSGRVRRIMAGGMAVLFVLFHLIVAPLSTPPRSTVVKMMRMVTEAGTSSIGSEDEIRGRTLVVAVAPDIFTSAFLPVWRASAGLPGPRRVEVLSNSVGPVEFTRADERTLEIRMEGGQFKVWTHALVRKSTDRWDVGRMVKRSDCTIRVLEATEEGEPVTISVEFDVPLDDPSLRWVAWEGGGYLPFELPGLGENRVWDIDESKIFGSL